MPPAINPTDCCRPESDADCQFCEGNVPLAIHLTVQGISVPGAVHTCERCLDLNGTFVLWLSDYPDCENLPQRCCCWTSKICPWTCDSSNPNDVYNSYSLQVCIANGFVQVDLRMVNHLRDSGGQILCDDPIEPVSWAQAIIPVDNNQSCVDILNGLTGALESAEDTPMGNDCNMSNATVSIAV